MNSGIPYNITTGFDNNGDTVPNDRPLGISRNTGAGPGYASVDFHLSKRITFAKNESKDGGARPAEKHASGRLSNLGEGRREGHGRWLEVGIDAFNVFNRVNFKNFQELRRRTDLTFFGHANSASPARQLQFSMKFHF